VTVHAHLEKMGLTTELVTAADGESIRLYMAGRNISLPEQSVAVIDGYTGKKYSFVVTTVTDIRRFNEETGDGKQGYHNPYEGSLGVFVRFPADRIYYPLRPTGVYGDRIVPVYLYITGFADPASSPVLRSATGQAYAPAGTEVRFYRQPSYSPAGPLLPFFNGQQEISPLAYTKVTLRAPAGNYTDDLWIDQAAPPGLAFEEWFIKYSAVIAIATFLALSVLSGLAAGIICMRGTPALGRDLALHGLWNCFTMVGFVIATRRKFNPQVFRHRTAYIAVYYIVFAGALAALAILLARGIYNDAFWWLWALALPLLIVAIPFYLVAAMPWLGLPLAAVIAFFLLMRYTSWLAPGGKEPVRPAAAEDHAVQAAPGQGPLSRAVHGIPADLSALPAYERRWGAVLVVSVALVIAGALAHATAGTPLLTSLGVLGVILSVFMYAVSIFGVPEYRVKIIAVALLVVPAAISTYLTLGFDSPAESLATIIAGTVIMTIILAAAVWVKRLAVRLLTGSVPEPGPRPDMRVVLVTLLAVSLVLTPQVLGSAGLENPRAAFLTERGDQLASQGRYNEAAEAYSQALRSDAEYVPALEHRGDVYTKQGYCGSARMDYSAALRIQPGNAAIAEKLRKADQACRAAGMP
jgi:tetratricopeptide (TPR) repeat protein